jgi:protein-S-isoprenylcysteine O-methyltransferase Ste14
MGNIVVTGIWIGPFKKCITSHKTQNATAYNSCLTVYMYIRNFIYLSKMCVRVCVCVFTVKHITLQQDSKQSTIILKPLK